jgi:hypothetical protein
LNELNVSWAAQAILAMQREQLAQIQAQAGAPKSNQ